MKPYIIFLLLGFLSFYSIQLKAQEKLVQLSTHPVLINSTDQLMDSPKSVDAVKLPFVDDFSYNSFRPDNLLWEDRDVLINKSYGVDVVSIGVATFDAVDANGKVYSTASSFPDIMDVLTSQAIRLDSSFGSTNFALQPSDSIYLSFYVQPQGMGNKPEEEDSLILQFFKPNQNSWHSVWNLAGSSLDSFITQYNNAFQLFMIPITDTAYLQDGFKFRFANYASIADNSIPSFKSGMYDHWNLDYVVLDYNRTVADSGFYDVVVQTEMTTMLVNYISMPWNQYLINPTGELKDTAHFVFENLDNQNNKNLNQYFSIMNLDDKTEYKDNPYPATINMGLGETREYHSRHNSNYVFNSNASPFADFEVVFRIFTNSPPADINRQNDTMKFYQRFYNYYAYDDGVPEAGYGLSTANGRVAYQFNLNTPDSLQAVQLYFNNTQGDANQQYFFLTVWDDNGGQPGNIIYEQSGVRPEFDDSLFRFITYELDNALYLSGTFYIGWRQTTGDNLNVGFDYQMDNHDKIFYSVGGNWATSSYAGSIMMRPILGNLNDAHVNINNQNKTDFTLSVYPNPNTSNILYIDADLEMINHSQSMITIYNSNGQMMYQQSASESIDITNLNSGIYYLSFLNSEKNIQIQRKIVIIK